MRIIIGILGAFVLSVFGGLLYLYAQIRFDAYTIIDYKPRLTTQLFDRQGRLVANLFENEHRLYASYDQIPPRVVEALVAIEDTAFFEHSGINIEAIFRAIIKDIQAMALVEGASTITQQLVKNVVLSREKTFRRKINEIILAFKIESELTKEEILERYLNHVYFGHGYYGIKTAAWGYFGKSLNALTLKEIAILVGLPRAPSAYDPTRNLDLALARANQVLSRMNTLGWVSEEEYIAALNELPVVYDETLTQNRAPYVVDEVIRQAGALVEDLRRGGYEIHLSIDLSLQEAAHRALNLEKEAILKRNPEADEALLNGALIAMENGTGDVLALVGGVDYSRSHFNRAIQSSRQPGSSFKPFIYQRALDVGYSPASLIPDISRVYVDKESEDEWKPRNYGENFDGLITLKEALVHSRNLATINLLSSLGLDVVHRDLTRAGFERLPQDLTIALGSFGISPMAYAQMYSAFPNGGEMVQPIIIKKIVDRFGNTRTFEPSRKRLTTPQQSYLMVDILKEAVNRGTGRRAQVPGLEIAGKTGTTNNNVDAWFCGFSPEIEVLVWFGNDDNTPMNRSETGGRSASAAFGDFMKQYLSLYPQTRRAFVRPEGVESAVIGGTTVLHTKTSPLPRPSQEIIQTQEGGLIF